MTRQASVLFATFASIVLAFSNHAYGSFAEYSAAVQSLNPVAYYHLSEASDATAAADAAAGGTATDNGTFNNFSPANFQANSVWDILGVAGDGDTAPQFDGNATAGGPGTYISVPPSADLIPLSMNSFADPVVGDVSFAFFIYKDDASRRFIGGWRPTSGSFFSVEWTTSSRLNLEGRGVINTNEVDVFSNANLLPETLYHVVISLDVNEDDNLQTSGVIYVNGQDNTDPDVTVYREAGVVPGIDAFELSTANFDLGRWGGDGFYWNGMIDEFAIFNKALTAQEALDLYNAAVPQQVPGDFDSDGDVDGADFVAWQTNFPTAEGAMLEDGDADGDGDVDGADFVVWQTNFPFTPAPGTATVPEPLAFYLMAIGLCCVAAGKRFGRRALSR